MYKSIILISFILFHSCGDKVKTNQEKIIGTWIGNLCDDKVNINKDTFIFNNSDIVVHKGLYGRDTINNYVLNQNNILVNNIIAYNLNFLSDVSLKLTEKSGTIDNIYCLGKK